MGLLGLHIQSLLWDVRSDELPAFYAIELNSVGDLLLVIVALLRYDDASQVALPVLGDAEEVHD